MCVCAWLNMLMMFSEPIGLFISFRNISLAIRLLYHIMNWWTLIHLRADFEDMSCEMIYGQVPPPLEEDPVSKQPCYPNLCECSQIPQPQTEALHLQNGLVTHAARFCFFIQVPCRRRLPRSVPNFRRRYTRGWVHVQCTFSFVKETTVQTS